MMPAIESVSGLRKAAEAAPMVVEPIAASDMAARFIWAADEIERLRALRNAIVPFAYLDVTNLGSYEQSDRPARYFECRLCGDWNDEAKHIEHADGCPLAIGHQQQPSPPHPKD